MARKGRIQRDYFDHAATFIGELEEFFSKVEGNDVKGGLIFGSCFLDAAKRQKPKSTSILVQSPKTVKHVRRFHQLMEPGGELSLKERNDLSDDSTGFVLGVGLPMLTRDHDEAITNMKRDFFGDYICFGAMSGGDYRPYTIGVCEELPDPRFFLEHFNADAAVGAEVKNSAIDAFYFHEEWPEKTLLKLRSEVQSSVSNNRPNV